MEQQPPRPPASIRQRPLWGLVLKAVGLVALSLGMTFGSIGYAGLRSGGSRGLQPVHPVLAVALMAVLLGFGRWAYRQGSRHRARLLEPLTTAEAEPIVLLLRSFDDDRHLARIQGGDPRHGPWAAAPTTEEQQLGNATAAFGRMVALGSPRDSLPPVGAGRDYAGDEEWRARVLAGLARARLVLLIASPGDAVRWETERVIERNLAHRLVVIITGDGQRYEAFRTDLSARFPRGLPEYRPVKRASHVRPYVQAVVWFDADWTPHLAALGDEGDLRSMIIKVDRWVETALPLAIWPLYGRAGIPVPGLPSELRTRPWTVPAAIALAAPAVVTVEALLIRSALHGNAWSAAISGVLALLLILVGRQVWRGGYWTVRMTAFCSAFFGGGPALASLVTLFLREGPFRWWLASAALGLLAAGLLLAGRPVRDWTASLVLFQPGAKTGPGPATTGPGEAGTAQTSGRG
ncbi:hypothetical protein [Micromonospora sp. WMMD998]|uniref:hypothetical protein n=1 Tax=Micromonospora sp. WMMD998 TaxID=3016092 RepID=UPI00249A2904|nr:hypothetical protein [Micromonospora sp. WMMD998]WFE39803.1 hypothetical protein O7619_15760 [Micromonospora sp. WMMD998]